MYITPKLDWDSTDYHNFTDKNRVESNTDYVNTQLAILGDDATLTTPVTSRDNTYIDYKGDFNRIANNITAIKDAFAEPAGWVDLENNWIPATTPFDFNVANAWEKNIDLLNESISGTVEYIPICGTFFASSTNPNLQRFSRGR